jgi:hypothetical protein
MDFAMVQPQFELVFQGMERCSTESTGARALRIRASLKHSGLHQGSSMRCNLNFCTTFKEFSVLAVQR